MVGLAADLEADRGTGLRFARAGAGRWLLALFILDDPWTIGFSDTEIFLRFQSPESRESCEQLVTSSSLKSYASVLGCSLTVRMSSSVRLRVLQHRRRLDRQLAP